MASSTEVSAMRRAIALATAPEVPLGPNPRVGAVVLAPDGTTLGEGRHRGAGTPHAEVDALSAAGDRAVGATVVVTLEPCNHEGRTGPCSEALIAAQVARVVVAQPDLTPQAQGGVRRLRDAGIEVEEGVLADEAAAMNPWWSFAQDHQRPFVTWKFAATLDGRSAAADGTSQWITSDEARADVHRLRAQCDAVMVGTGTVLADDPQLTVRLGEVSLPADRQPRRIIVGERDLPADARVFDEAARTLVVASRDPALVLEQAYENGCQHVWLEGGPTLAAAFLRASLVDEIVAYIAPALLGSGRSAVGDLGIETIDDMARFTISDAVRVGPDLRITMEVAP